MTPFRGVRAPADGERDLESLCRAYVERMAEDQYFSHLTAARLHGFWLPSRFQLGEPIHVSVTDTARAPRIPGVVGHHVDPDRAAWTWLDGLPVAVPLEAARMLAPALSIEALVVVLDSLRQRSGRLVSEPELLYMLAKHGGQRGVRKLRAAFALSREGSASAKETTLRRGVVRAGLPEPEVNALISRPGEPERYGDLVWRRWRVVAEYEGVQHQSDRGTYVGDITRFEELSPEWSFVRVTKEHLADFRAIAVRILRARRQ
ncbi:hypothetical protein [Protaetiibacter larvae]|uniref:hypothetical protein n=1 Tax=Protaetiibacter larvae TaxID=2592654 RepID=UPI001AEF543B|nr:hypothetical protein [Protaetiibacter larvae]